MQFSVVSVCSSNFSEDVIVSLYFAKSTYICCTFYEEWFFFCGLLAFSWGEDVKTRGENYYEITTFTVEGSGTAQLMLSPTPVDNLTDTTGLLQVLVAPYFIQITRHAF
jgi:hypothetical protein